MDSLLDLQRWAANENAMKQQAASGITDVFGQYVKNEMDKKRREENIKEQMNNYQTIMKQMSEMTDNSANGKANRLLGDDSKYNSTGITNISGMIPTREVSFDGTNMNIKIGMKTATPSEQKSLVDIQKTRNDMDKEARKSDFINKYISGQIPEGAFIQEIGSLGLTPEEFEYASAARRRLETIQSQQQQVIPSGYQATELQRDQMGNFIPSRATMIQQPTEMDKLQEEQARLNIQKTQQDMMPQQQPQQGFNVPEGMVVDKFDQFGNPIYRPKTAQDVKAEMDIEATKRAEENRSQASIDIAQNSIDTINTLLSPDKLKYFGAAGEIVPPLPMEYSKKDWEANYEYITSKNIVSLINEMKSQSRTGATGFGQLNREELKVLMNASQKLRKGLDEKTAAKYLNEMKHSFQKILDRERNGYPGEQAGQNQSTTDFSSEQDAMNAGLPKGTIVTINGRRARID